MRKTALLLATLAGLALASPSASAESPVMKNLPTHTIKKPKKDTIIAKLPSEKEIRNSRVIKKLPTEEDIRRSQIIQTLPTYRITDKRWKKDLVISDLPEETDIRPMDFDDNYFPIPRNHIQLGANYSKSLINGKKYSEGTDITLDTVVQKNLSEVWNLKSTLNLDFKSLGILSEDATENLIDIKLLAEARARLKLGKARQYITFGAEANIAHEKLKYKGENAFKFRAGAGPLIGYSYESKNFDFHLTAAAMLGKKKSSYDIDRNIHIEHLRFQLIPRYLQFSFPLTIEGSHWAVTDIPVDRPNFEAKISFKPEYRFNPNFALTLNLSYAYRGGEDFYQVIEAGLGGKVTW
jgi:hypothetical protein